MFYRHHPDSIHRLIDSVQEWGGFVKHKGLIPLNESQAKIISEAAVLFARHGFHGVTTRQIASAVGLNIATVHYHVGSKQDLYTKIHEIYHQEEQALFTEIFERATERPIMDADELPLMISGIVDRLLDFFNDNPVRVRFQLRYWLDTETGQDDIQAEADLSLYKRIDEVLQATKESGIIRLDVDSGLFLRGLYMLIYGYFLSGAFDWTTLRGDPHDQAHLQAFKGLLLAYLCKMMNIPQLKGDN